MGLLCLQLKRQAKGYNSVSFQHNPKLININCGGYVLKIANEILC